MGGFSGWGGATDYLNEALERKKREEEEARQRAASAALLLRLARDKVSKPPVGVAAPQPQAQPQQRPSVADLMSRPQVDTGAPPISYSEPINNTVESDIEPQVQRRLPNSPIVQPRPNLPGINQRLPKGPPAQPEYNPLPSSPWQSPSRFNAPQQEYQLKADEPYSPSHLQQQVFASQPDPIQNRVVDSLGIQQGVDTAGDFVQDRWNDVKNWWNQSGEPNRAPQTGSTSELVQGLGLTPNANANEWDNQPNAWQWYLQQPAGQYMTGTFNDRWGKANDSNPVDVAKQSSNAPEWWQGIGKQLGLPPEVVNKVWQATPLPAAQTAWAAIDDPFKYAGAAGMAGVDLAFDALGRVAASTPRDELGNYLFGLKPMEAGSGEQLPIMSEILAAGGVVGKAIKDQTYGNPMQWGANLLGGLVSGGGVVRGIQRNINELARSDQYTTNLNAFWGAKTYIDSLPAGAKKHANLGWAMAISGGDAVYGAGHDLATWTTQITGLQTAAAAAAHDGDQVTAAQLAARSIQMAKMSPIEIIEQHMNPAAEVVYGIAVDPTSWIGELLHLGKGAGTLVRYQDEAKKLLTVGEDAARSNIGTALVEAQGRLDAVSNGQKVNADEWLKYVNPLTWFNRTPASKANVDANWLLSTVADVTKGVTTKEDAKTILSALRNDATQLINGLPLVSPTTGQFRNAENLVKFDPALVGNAHVAKRLPILQLLPPDWVSKLRSLEGEGTFNPREMLVEADGMLYDAARQYHGAVPDNALPFSAVDMKVRRLPDGTAVVDYFDQNKKLIRSTEAMTFVEASNQVDSFKQAAKGGSNPVANAAKGVWNFQRGIMSDMFLALSPRNTIRNALGAATLAYSVDGYDGRRVQRILDEIAHDHGGGAPNLRTLAAMTDYNRGQLPGSQLTSGAIDPLAQWFTKDSENPISRFMRWNYDRSYGKGEIPVGGGMSFGVGEEANYVKVYGAGYSRTKANAWREEAYALEQTLINGGVPEKWAERMSWLLADSGPRLNKSDLSNKAYDLVMSEEGRIASMKALGLDSDILPNEQWSQLDELLSNLSQYSDEDAAARITEIFDEARQYPARTMSEFYPQQGHYEWTDVDNTVTGGVIQQSLQDAARRASVDLAQAQPQIDAVVKQVEQADKGWDTFGQDFAGLTSRAINTGGAHDMYRVAIDYATAIQELKGSARIAVDEAGRRAVAMQSPEAWARKWQTNLDEWGKYAQGAQKLTEEYRTALSQVAAGQAYTPKSDPFKTIARWMQFDPEAFKKSRTYELTKPTLADSWMWEDVIKQNRDALDHSQLHVLEAFRRYPTSTNFDLLTNATREIDRMAANVAGFIEKTRAGGLQGQAYYKLRNTVWTQFFDEMSNYNKAMGKVMVALGVTDEAGAATRWTDDFAGGEFRLLYPNEDGTWTALRTDDKTQHIFSTPGQGFGGDARPEVPQSVIGAYNTALGRGNEIVDQVAEEIAKVADNAPAPTRTLSPYTRGGPMRERNLAPWATGTVEQPQRVPAGETTWAESATESSLPGYNGADLRRTEPLPDEIPSTAQADRATYYDQEIGQWVEGQRTKPVSTTPAEGMPSAPTRVDDIPLSTPISTPISTPADIRRAATEAGIATATSTGAPTDRHLLASLKKRANIRAASLADLTDSERVAAMEALGARKAEQAAQPLNQKLTKPQLIEQYGDQLRQQGLTDQQISRMSKAEMVKAIEAKPEVPKTSSTPSAIGTGNVGGTIEGQRRAKQIEAQLHDLGTAHPSDDLAVSRKRREAVDKLTAELAQLQKGSPDLLTSSKRLMLDQMAEADASAGKPQIEDYWSPAERQYYEQQYKQLTGGAAAATTPSTIGTGNAPAFGQGRTTAPSTTSMFAETGEDLPLVSGAAPRPQDKGPFKPAVVGGQESMFDTRPTMGGGEPTYAPKVPKEPKVTTVGDVAKVEGAAALDTQRTLSKEWDRVAVGEFGLPPIDTLIARFKRNGAINLSLDKGEVKLFEDLYGNTIAGMPINNLDDVETFLQQYNGFGQQVKGSKAAVAKSKTFSKMSGPEIVKSVADELRAAGLDDAEIAELATQPRRTILDTVESIRGETPDQPGMVAYDFAVPALNETDAGKDLYQTLLDRIRNSRRNGGMKSPEVGEAASHILTRIDRAEQKLQEMIPELRNGMPNVLTPEQRLQAWDQVRTSIAKHDNILAQARYVGDKLGNFVMLNKSTDGRYGDSILSILFPFSFFQSRMPSRLLSMPFNKPGLANLYYEVGDELSKWHKQQGTPDRLGGTIPLGDGLFAGNPLAWMIPYSSYGVNPYMDPADAEGDIERNIRSVLQFIPGLMPALQIGLAAGLDAVEPRKDGTKRTDDFELGDYVPQYRGLGYAYQGLTGQTGPQNALNWGDNLDVIRARKNAAAMAVEQGIDQTTTDYAQQIIVNRYSGKPEGEGIDPAYLEEATALADQAIKGTGQERALATGGSLLTATPFYMYREGEREGRADSQQYNQLGYSPEGNTYGSKEARDEFLEQNPELPAWWTRNDKAPGMAGDISALYDQIDKLKTEDPTGNKNEIAALYDQINRLKTEMGKVTGEPDPLPQPSPVVGSTADILRGSYGDAYGGMNPQEQLEKQQEDTATKFWDEYLALPKEDDSRAQYLRDNPDFVPIYDANETKKGREVNHWWEQGGGDSSSSNGSGASTIPTANNGRTPVADSDAPTYKDVKEDADYYFKNFLLSDNRDFDAEMAWLVEHPDVAEYEWRRYEKKNGKLPWWYEQYYGEEGAGNGKGAPRQPVYNPLPGNKLGEGYTVSDSYYNQSSNGSGAAGIGRRGGGGGGGSDAYGQNWDEYKAFGDDYDAKRKYMLEHPEFADYYVKRYGKDSAWWLESYGGGGSGGRGKGGGSGPNPYAQNWDDYAAFGDDYDAKKQYMLEHPEFAKYYIERYGEDSAWWLRESGGGGGGGAGARTYTYYGGGGGGGYGGGGGGGSPSYYHGLAVNPAYMNRDLWQGPQQAQRNWVPYSDPQPEWLRAGQQIAPEPIRKWQPPRWNG